MAKEGEGKLLLEQIRQISQDILSNLMDIEDKLSKLQDSVKYNEEINKEALLNQITEIRLRIGVMEREDTQEIEEEKILENLITKINSLIDITFGQ